MTGRCGFSSSSYTVDEGSNRTVTVLLNGESSQNLTIPIVVTPGTDRSVTINSGSTSGTVSIPTSQDTDCDDETLILGFGTLPTGVQAGTRNTMTVTIADTDICINGPQGPRHAEGSTDDVATYTADPSDDITWSLSGDDQGLFNISGGVLTFRSPPNFENPQDSGGNNVYNVTVTASRSGYGSGSRDVTVRVTNVNEPPMITGDRSPSYAENRTDVVEMYTAADPEGDPISWDLPSTAHADDRRDFDINSDGELEFEVSPDYEDPHDDDEDNDYLVTVRASDGNGGSDSIDVTVTVTNIEEPEITLTGSASSVKVGREVVLTVSASDLDPNVDYSVLLSRPSSNSNIGFDSDCSDRSESLVPPARGSSFTLTETLNTCAATGGTVTAQLRAGGSDVSGVSDTYRVNVSIPTVLFTGVTTVVNGEEEGVEVRVGNLDSTLTYTVETTASSDIALDDACTDREDSITISPTDPSWSRSITVYGCSAGSADLSVEVSLPGPGAVASRSFAITVAPIPNTPPPSTKKRTPLGRWRKTREVEHPSALRFQRPTATAATP